MLTTHYMDEAEQLCDRLVVMDHGKIAEEGSPLELIRGSRRARWSSCASPARRPQIGARACSTGTVARVEVLPDRLLLYTDDGDALVPVAHERLQPQSVLVRRSTLEDVFLRLTGRTLDRLMAYSLRAYEYWLTVYRRVWRGTSCRASSTRSSI